jgi:internalin A
LIRSEGIRQRLSALDAGELTAFPLTEVNVVIKSVPASLEPSKTVFVSYSHKDVKWLNAIKTTLVPLVRNGLIIPWDDTKIRAGDLWKTEIEKALDTASLAILIVTPNFIESPYITDKELPPILEAAKKRGLRILWIPASASFYEQTPLAEYQAVHDPARPLDSLEVPNRRKALVQIAKEIAAELSKS